jgi:hypothetical protein
MYNVEILADSLSPQGHRLTTMKITFPRFILAEFNTHRMFSRNSASSRAIPFAKMVKTVEENPFIPIAWQKDHKGMQGSEYITDDNDYGAIACCKEDWLKARDNAVVIARDLNYLGVTKQLCNRLLEPFMWHTVIVTSGKEGLDNFFNLRCPQYVSGYKLGSPEEKYKKVFRSWKDLVNYHFHELKSNRDVIDTLDNYTIIDKLKVNQSQAEIHIQAIAELMWDAINLSVPKELKAGEWHIPFGDNINIMELDNFLLHSTKHSQEDREDIMENPLLEIKITTARCARISYQTLGDNPKIDYEADIRLHDMLLESKHMSPFEHCARAMRDDEYRLFVNGETSYSSSELSVIASINDQGWCRNFRGFIQYRYIVETK